MNSFKILTQALHQLLACYQELGYSAEDTLKICNLVLEGHLQQNGEFTTEYIKLAAQAQQQQTAVLTPQIWTIIP